MEHPRLTARQPNKRSTLFIWHTAEEKGLLGSAWFAAHPTVPMDSIVGLLNVDMIGRNGSDSLFIIGPRVAPNGQSQRLGAIVDSVNGASGRPFIIDRSADDANHPEMLYQRSDHIHYAKRGVPVAFFTTGIHPDYHDVTDDMSRIDLSKLARVTGLLYDVGRAVGNDARRPR
jgi:Zn-dependent M28 family amino/carboxypeptidase